MSSSTHPHGWSLSLYPLRILNDLKSEPWGGQRPRTTGDLRHSCATSIPASYIAKGHFWWEILYAIFFSTDRWKGKIRTRNGCGLHEPEDVQPVLSYCMAWAVPMQVLFYAWGCLIFAQVDATAPLWDAKLRKKKLHTKNYFGKLAPRRYRANAPHITARYSLSRSTWRGLTVKDFRINCSAKLVIRATQKRCSLMTSGLG